jgi:hypothetical protein
VQTYIATTASPTIDGSTFLVVVGFMALLAALITTLWASWNWIGRQVAYRRYLDEHPNGLYAPAVRDAGCVECEACDELGYLYLIRHQQRDHADGVRTW